MKRFEVACLMAIAGCAICFFALKSDIEHDKEPIDFCEAPVNLQVPEEFQAKVAADKAANKRCDGWESFARKVKGKNPQCAYCGLIGTDKTIEAHHIHAFELMTPEQRGTNAKGGELDPENIIILCRLDHLKHGHEGNFKNSDPNIVEVCRKHRDEMKANGTWPIKGE